jgi:hypothetical protein
MDDSVTRGERGPPGDHGQEGAQGHIGETGRQGEPGEKGRTGEPGRSTFLERNVATAYLLLAVVIAIVLVVMGWVVSQNRAAIKRTCEATNESRAINNRDRLTLLRGARTALANAEIEKDPNIERLLREGAASSQREADARPYLEPLPGCKAPDPFPPRDLPD